MDIINILNGFIDDISTLDNITAVFNQREYATGAVDTAFALTAITANDREYFINIIHKNTTKTVDSIIAKLAAKYGGV